MNHSFELVSEGGGSRIGEEQLVANVKHISVCR